MLFLSVFTTAFGCSVCHVIISKTMCIWGTFCGDNNRWKYFDMATYGTFASVIVTVYFDFSSLLSNSELHACQGYTCTIFHSWIVFEEKLVNFKPWMMVFHYTLFNICIYIYTKTFCIFHKIMGSSVNNLRVSFRTVINKPNRIAKPYQTVLRRTKLLLTVNKLNWCLKYSSLTELHHHKELNCTVK